MLRGDHGLILATPFFLQSAVLFVDEFYCHYRRELRKWERIGHPIDTFAFSACFLSILFLDSETPTGNFVYLLLSVISCLLITKDEWQHKELSSGFENWLHSLLFMLHPFSLFWMFLLWHGGHPDAFLLALYVFIASMAFGFYQLFYWNLRYDRQ